MKTFARIATVLVLMTAATGMTFAANNHSQLSYGLNMQTIADQTTVGTVEVPVNAAIRAYFQAHGVDGSKLDAPLGTLNQKYKDDIDDLFADSDRNAEIQAVVFPVLKAALVRGSIEQATMRIGRHVLTLSIDGPEDHDNE